MIARLVLCLSLLVWETPEADARVRCWLFGCYGIRTHARHHYRHHRNIRRPPAEQARPRPTPPPLEPIR